MSCQKNTNKERCNGNTGLNHSSVILGKEADRCQYEIPGLACGKHIASVNIRIGIHKSARHCQKHVKSYVVR